MARPSVLKNQRPRQKKAASSRTTATPRKRSRPRPAPTARRPQRSGRRQAKNRAQRGEWQGATGSWPGILSLVLGALGAAVYFFGVHFTLGNGGATLGADRTAASLSVGLGALLCLLGAILAATGLRRPGRRAPAAIGMLLCTAFFGFCLFSLIRGG